MVGGLGPDWGSFSDTIRDAHSQMWDLTTVTFYNFSGGYDPSTGETDNWTDDGGTEVDAEIVAPDNPQMTTGPSGQDAEVKFRAYIRDDAPVDIYEVGTENRRPTELSYQGDRYIVTDVFDENNGMLRLLCMEA